VLELRLILAHHIEDGWLEGLVYDEICVLVCAVLDFLKIEVSWLNLFVFGSKSKSIRFSAQLNSFFEDNKESVKQQTLCQKKPREIQLEIAQH